MHKVFGFFALFCVSCAYLPPPSTPDNDVGRVRHEMATTVKINMHVVVDAKDAPAWPGPFVTGWTGTGVIYAKDKAEHEVLILTANHVCEDPAEDIRTQFGVLHLRELGMVVMFSDGYTTLARRIYQDVRHDVCVIVAYSDSGEVAELARARPPVGSRVTNPGSPRGMMEPGLVPYNEGFYAGVMRRSEGMALPQDVMYFTVPVQPGSSGSGVFYRGQLVGIVSMKAGGEHTALAVPTEWVNLAAEFGYRRWREGR